jgi:peptide/nickel transport system ATP-binding protein
MPAESPPMVETRALSKRFVQRPDLADRLAALLTRRAPGRPELLAVDEVSLAVRHGEVLGLVGESGCGKSTLGRTIAGIIAPTSGQVLLEGVDRATMPAAERARTGLKLQMIFQDPMSSLNPRKRVIDIIGEAPLVHGLVTRAEQDDYVCRQMLRVGLDPAFRRRLPHQFSGGQRQRVGIARALAVQPTFLVCDEAIAALDVSIQAQVINLFIELREELQLTYLFISHDLSVVEHISDRIAIMYLGRIVELAATEEFYRAPNHPYAQLLLAEVPRIGRTRPDRAPPSGEIPSPLAPPPGCHFHPRCPHAFARCRTEVPALREIAPGRHSACHLNDANE